MNQLISLRTNIYYEKDKNAEMRRVQEIIFLVDKPAYTYTNEGDVIRQREIQEMRFCATESHLKQIIEALTAYSTISEEELDGHAKRP